MWGSGRCKRAKVHKLICINCRTHNWYFSSSFKTITTVKYYNSPDATFYLFGNDLATDYHSLCLPLCLVFNCNTGKNIKTRCKCLVFRPQSHPPNSAGKLSQWFLPLFKLSANCYVSTHLFLLSKLMSPFFFFFSIGKWPLPISVQLVPPSK